MSQPKKLNDLRLRVPLKDSPHHGTTMLIDLNTLFQTLNFSRIHVVFRLRMLSRGLISLQAETYKYTINFEFL